MSPKAFIEEMCHCVSGGYLGRAFYITKSSRKSQEAINVTCPEFANRKGIVFYQDNTRHHVSLQRQQKLFKLGCSSAPSGYNLFRPYKIPLMGRTLVHWETVKTTWISLLLI